MALNRAMENILMRRVPSIRQCGLMGRLMNKDQLIFKKYLIKFADINN